MSNLMPVPEVIKPGTLVLVGQPDYKKDFVFECKSGFGLDGRHLGSKIFGRFIDDGEETYIRRDEIKGVFPEVEPDVKSTRA